MGRNTVASTKAKTHIISCNGRTVEISDADFESLAKTGKANVTDLRTGEVVTVEVTHWRILVEDCDREAYRSMTEAARMKGWKG